MELLSKELLSVKLLSKELLSEELLSVELCYNTLLCGIRIWREAPDCLRATRFLQRQVCGWNRRFWDFQIEV